MDLTQQLPKVEETSTPEQFQEEYESLCKRTGFRLVAVPQWVPTNHGTFELTLQHVVGEMPHKQTQ